VLKKLRFESDGFNRIVVELKSIIRPATYVNSCQVAGVDIEFDRKRIDAVDGIALTHLQIELLKSGIEKCALTHSIPKTELLQGLDAFVEQGMKNEWLHKKRTFKEHAFSAALTCKMTQSSFALWLTVMRQNTLVFEDVILETDPDEIAFHWKFKDMVVTDGNLVVTAKISRPLWARSLAELK